MIDLPGGGRASWSLILATSVASLLLSPAAAGHDPSVVDLVDWFTARDDAVFSPKQEIRALESPDLSMTGLGVFATERIEEGELLFSIPWDMVIQDDDDEDDGEPEDTDAVSCVTVRKLIDEMRLVTRQTGESTMEPYILFLLKQEREQIPSAWSEAGQNLFSDVLGGETFPPEMALGWEDWYERCGHGDDPDGFQENAAMLAVQRANNDGMLPLHDFYYHRNGRYLNTVEGTVEGEKHTLTASRVIEEGEQIYTSINTCANCEDLYDTYGTPEIFRETGVIEQMPQRWIMSERSFGFDLEEKDDGSGEIEVSWINDVKITHMGIEFLRKEILRLERLQKLEADNEEVPEHEMSKIWTFSDALVAAMKHALKSALGGEEDACLGGDSEDGTCIVSDGYDPLDDEEDDMYWDEDHHQNLKPLTCETDLSFTDFTTREETKSIYQEFGFDENNDTDDMCFDIDNIVQICANYRPHYHEYNMDFPARYIDDVRRVVFVGGGDSMLLYETLKYPNVELVVGLELDQKVVRKAFKYFHTQPHFDDDRVEWWFGDATKSLLMLPKDYFGSFDLVLVDLSETVMSFKVTNELDVFESLALLLSPDGVMIKNELHLEKMSTIFDYTAQIYLPQVPTICDQIVVMGSNRADFLTHDVKDHKVNTLLLEPLDQIENRFDLFHDYRKNDARAQGRCDVIDTPEENTKEQKGLAGVLMIVDVEDTTVPLLPLDNLARALSDAVKKEGFSPLSTVASSSDDDGVVAVIVMEEGYVAARVWPDHKYCAFDIHLWGASDKMKSVRDALVAAVGSSTASMSSFRIVVGGMLGASTLSEDQKSIGPRNTQKRNCDEDTSEISYISDQESIDIALEETLTLIEDGDAVAVVLCGIEGEPCKSLDVIAKSSKFGHVIPLWTCPDVAGDPRYSEDVASRMISCERNTIDLLDEALEEGELITSFIVDSSAPVPMVKIANSIWSSRRNIDLLTPHVLFVAVMLDESETWRKKHNFLDRTRKTLEYDPIFAAELVLSSEDGKMEIGVLRSGDADFFRHLDGVAKNVKKRSNMDVEVRRIQGGMIRTQEFEPRLYKREDYNNQPGIDQFSNQKSLGRQSVFQLNSQDGESAVSRLQVVGVLGFVFSEMKYSVTKLQTLVGVGDGSAVVAIFSEGSAVVVWDGSNHIDINLFTFDESEEKATQVVDLFMEKIPGMKMSLRDEMPRGVGRVVSFSKEM